MEDVGSSQAKFKVPRNISMAKIFDKAWRPQAHCVGVVMHGICEIYFFMDTNIQKDSNAQRTILTRSLEIANEILARRGLGMASDWVLHAIQRSCLVPRPCCKCRCRRKFSLRERRPCCNNQSPTSSYAAYRTE